MEQLTAMERFTNINESGLLRGDAELPRLSASTRRPSLLPAFEPISSSPPQISLKRKHEEAALEGRLYPTPIPTSSTGILPSSPPHRSTLQRTQSTVSERNPLADVPTVNVPASGEPVLLGRSSNSCNFQLPYNRHISRVHASLKYLPPDSENVFGRIEVKCLGWNGAIVRCGGCEHTLEKDDSFSSNQPAAEVIIDIQDTRVIVAWPATPEAGQTWDEDSSPERLSAANARPAFGSSPPPLFPQSPVSPSPARQPAPAQSSLQSVNLLTSSTQTIVQVYEDPDSDHIHEEESSLSPSRPSLSRQVSGSGKDKAKMSQDSLLSSVSEDLSDQENEENDPIVHSFGPFGSNILSRLSSFSTSGERKSPTGPTSRRRMSPKSTPLSPQYDSAALPTGSKPKYRESPIKNHVINQLAFSRVHAIPLSTIHGNLPAELKAASTMSNGTSEKDNVGDTPLTDAELKLILESIPCIGEITREGKDAAGKVLENEYYYVPEMDDNTMRRDNVMGGMGGTGLRAVRKNHKQYFWKRPRH